MTSTAGDDDIVEIIEDDDDEEEEEEVNDDGGEAEGTSADPGSTEGNGDSMDAEAEEEEEEGDGEEEEEGSSEAASESRASSSASASTTSKNTSEGPNKQQKKKRVVSKVPVSRVSAIMRTCPNLTTVKGDAVALTSHAAELFVRELVQQTIELAANPHHLTYNDLAEVIERSELTFLRDAIPPKMTAREYYQLRARQEAMAMANGEGGDCGQMEDDEEEED